MSREDALKKLQEPLYDERQLQQDKAYVAKKLGISPEELEKLMHIKIRDYSEFSSNQKIYAYMKKFQSLIETYFKVNKNL